MTGWSKHTGMATAIDIENIDTDQIIPARFMSAPRSDGYGGFLLHDLRFDTTGNPRPNFPINLFPAVSILVGRGNVGTGSSREAAVYALVDFGIRAVIAPSFGDIFAANCINNGVLPALVSNKAATDLIVWLSGRQAQLNINIRSRTISFDDQTVTFTLNDASAQKLLNGWDDIDLTQHHLSAIAAYRARRAQMQPWVFPANETAG